MKREIGNLAREVKSAAASTQYPEVGAAWSSLIAGIGVRWSDHREAALREAEDDDAPEPLPPEVCAPLTPVLEVALDGVEVLLAGRLRVPPKLTSAPHLVIREALAQVTSACSVSVPEASAVLMGSGSRLVVAWLPGSGIEDAKGTLEVASGDRTVVVTNLGASIKVVSRRLDTVDESLDVVLSTADEQPRSWATRACVLTSPDKEVRKR